jgi:hypothetical protein
MPPWALQQCDDVQTGGANATSTTVMTKSVERLYDMYYPLLQDGMRMRNGSKLFYQWIRNTGGLSEAMVLNVGAGATPEPALRRLRGEVGRLVGVDIDPIVRCRDGSPRLQLRETAPQPRHELLWRRFDTQALFQTTRGAFWLFGVALLGRWGNKLAFVAERSNLVSGSHRGIKTEG